MLVNVAFLFPSRDSFRQDSHRYSLRCMLSLLLVLGFCAVIPSAFAQSGPPATPSGLSATAGNGAIALSWGNVSGATSYNIYRGTSSGQESSTPIATGVTAATFTDSGVTNGTAYYYEVTAVDSGGESDRSNEASATPSASLPLEPANLIATAGNSQVILSWTASSGATSYNIYRGTTSGGENPVPIATDISATSFTDNGLSSGTTYYYEVTAANSVGQSLLSNEAAAAPLPPTPASLTASPGDTEITLSWTASSGSTSYNLYRGTTSGGESTIPIATAITATTYTDGHLTDGTTYYYKITAVYNSIESAKSSEAYATPEVAPPTGLIALPGSNQVALEWTAPVSSSVTGYNVYRGTTSGGEGTTPIASGVTTTTYIDNGAANGTTYYYKVTSINSDGESVKSNEASTTPQLTPPAGPTAPTELTATGYNTYISLAWTASSGATGYNVYRSTASDGEGAIPIATDIGTTTTAWTDNGAADGTTYYYEVTAINATGESGKSNEAHATPAYNPPPVPTNVKATAGNLQVSLSWSASTGARSYDLFRGLASDSETRYQRGIQTNSYLDTAVTNGTTYYYYVMASSSGGESGESSEVYATPQPPPPALTNLTSTAGNAAVALSWSAVSGANSYNIYRGVSSGGEGATPIATGITGLGITDTGVTNGTTYYYEVTAVNSSGEGNRSNETSATPSASLPLEPITFTAIAGNAQISLSWAASTGATSYDIYRGTVSGGEATTPLATGVSGIAYSDLTATNGTNYYYEVTAVNSSGQSLRSNEASAAAFGIPALTATGGPSQIALSWIAPVGVNLTYNLYRATASGQEALYESALTGTSYTDTDVTIGTTYYYKLTAVEAGVEGDMSNESSAAPYATPTAPASLTANGTTGSVGLTWTASTGATSYNIYRSTSAGGEGASPVGSSATTSYTDSSVTNGTTYYYDVTAVNPAGESGKSGQAYATPLAIPTLYASNGAGQILLTWSAIAGATGYNIYRASSSGQEGSTPYQSCSAVSFTDTSVTAGTIYYYQVTATAENSESGKSNEASASPTQQSSASALELVAWPGDGVVEIVGFDSFASYQPRVTSVNIERATSPSGPYTLIGTVSTPTETNNLQQVFPLNEPVAFQDTTAVDGTTYYYVGSEITSAGDGPNSNYVSATPGPNPQVAQGGSITFPVINSTVSVDEFDILEPLDQAYSVWWGVLNPGGDSTTISDLYINGVIPYLDLNQDQFPSNPWYASVGQQESTITVGCPNNATIAKNYFAGVDTGEYFWAGFVDVVAPSGSQPAAPTGLAATWNNGQISLTWQSSTNATSYNVYRTTDISRLSNPPYATGVSGTSFTDTNLANLSYAYSAGGAPTYYYYVTAVNGSGESCGSNTAYMTSPTETTILDPPPSAPYDVTAEPLDDSVRLAWTSSDGAFEGYSGTYIIKRSTQSGGPYTIIAGDVTYGSFGGTGTYTDSTVTNGVTYYYVVSAGGYSIYGGPNDEGNDSPEVSATPQAGITGSDNVELAPGLASASLTFTGTDHPANYQSWDIVDPNGNIVASASNPNGWSISLASPPSNSLYVYTITPPASVAQGRGYEFRSAGSVFFDIVSPGGGTMLPPAPTLNAANTLIGVGTAFNIGVADCNLYVGSSSGGETATPFASFSPAQGLPVDFILGLDFNFETTNFVQPNTLYYYNSRAIDSAGTSVSSLESAADILATYPQVARGSTSTIPVASENLQRDSFAPPTITDPLVSAMTAFITDDSLPDPNINPPLYWSVSGSASYTEPNGWQVSLSDMGYISVSVPVNATIGQYSITAWLPDGAFLVSDVDVVPSGPSAPAPPQLSASVNNGQVILNWTSVSGATGYEVKRSTYSGGPYQVISKNVQYTGYTDTQVNNNTTYYYVVSAVNSAGEGADSNEASASVGNPAGPQPDAPTLNAEGGDGEVVLSWTAISNATSYVLQRSTNLYGPYSIVTTTSNTTYVDTNVSDGTQYWYYVAAIDQPGQGEGSNIVFATPLAPGIPSVDAFPGNQVVNLTIINAAGYSDQTFNLYRSTTSGSDYTEIVAGLPAKPNANYTDTNVTDGTTYYYVAQGADPGGVSSYSNEVSATPGPPSSPTNLTATAGSNKVWLSWTASKNASSYAVDRSTTNGGPYSYLNQVVIAGTATPNSYTDYSAVNGTTYYYVVYGVNGNGISPPSNPASATPSAFDTGLHINCGGPVYTDNTYRHQTWIADQYYSGGSTYSTTNNITGTVDPTLYQTQRTGAFSYLPIGVPNGSYMLSLYMAETQYTSAGQRLFSVTANGSPILNNFDIFANAGANTALVKSFPIFISNNVGLTLNFTGNAAIAAIGLDLIPSIGGNNRVGSLGGGPVQDVPAPEWAEDAIPTDSSDAPGDGPSGSEDVSLPAGVEENNPGADIWAFNPVGPSVSYERAYRSSEAAAGYGSPGLSPGWTDNYDYAVEIPNAGTVGPLAFYYPNGGMEEWNPVLDDNGNPTGQIVPPAGAPYMVTGVPASGSPAWQSLTITWKDRTQFTFKPDPAGNSSLYRLSQITNLVGHYITINRDTSDLLTSIDNDAGTTLLSFSYQNGGLQTVSDDTSRSVTYGFTDLTTQNSSIPVLSTVSLINIPSITLWQYNYTVVNNEPFLNEVQTQDPGGSGTLVAASSQYDGDGRVQSHLDADSNTRTYTYTATDAQVEVQRPNGTQDLSYTQNFNTSNSNVDTGMVDAFGHSTSLIYSDPQNTYQPTYATNRNAQQSRFSYDPYGSVLESTDPRQVQTTSQMDYSSFGLGDVSEVQSANGTNILAPVQLFYYQPSDGVINGLVRDVFTAAPGGNSSTGYGSPVQTHYNYDSLGNVTSVIGPGPYSPTNGTTVTYNYGTSEVLGEPVSVTTSGTGYDGTTKTISESFRYDNRGNCSAAIDAMGYETDYAYNDADQCYQVTYPDPANGQIDSNSYTLNYAFAYTGGPVTSVTLKDGAGNTFRQVSYTLGHEGEVQSVSGDVLPVTYTYDSLYRPYIVTDGKNNKTTYAYDAVGNLSSITYQGGDEEKFTSYDNDGNLKTRIDGNNVETDYTYSDPESLLTKIHYPGGQLPDVTFGYDQFGRRSTMTDGTGSQGYTWDDLGDILTNTVNYAGGPQNVGIGYSYNPDGSTQQTALPESLNLNYAYDGLGRTVQIASNILNYPDTYSYGYDSDSRLTSVQTPASLTQYGYDALGEITSLTNSLPTYSGATFTGWTPISSYTGFTYDTAGNRLTETADVPGTPPDDGHFAPDASRALTYHYDNLNELTEEISAGNLIDGSYPYNDNYDEVFSYDAAGNATSFRGNGPNTFNTDNQLFNSGFGYDGNGNPLSYAGNAFDFDPENRATELTNTINGTATDLTATYDGDGMRAEADGNYYLYDGDDPVCALNSSGIVLAVNIFGPDGWRAQYGTNGQIAPFWFTYDPQGSLVQTLEGDGPPEPSYSVEETEAYDGYGAYLGSYTSDGSLASQSYSGSGFGGQWGYQTDPNTGYVFMTHRYYDPVNGRWINRDPIGTAGGINLYGFCGNNPITGADPEGTSGENPSLLQKAVSWFSNWLANQVKMQPGTPRLGQDNPSIDALRDIPGVNDTEEAREARPSTTQAIVQGEAQMVGDVGTTVTSASVPEAADAEAIEEARLLVTSGSFKGGKALSFDWEHIFEFHSDFGVAAKQRTRSNATGFWDLTKKQIVARVKAAWKTRQKVETQVDALGTARIRFRGIDPKSNETVEFWYNTDTKQVETAYPIR